VRRIAIELPVVGVDVVEVSPPYDAAEITSFLANRVVLEMLAGIAYRRNGGTWDTIPPTLLEGRS
jgi:arginase family enzyme